jgi:nitroreductase
MRDGEAAGAGEWEMLDRLTQARHSCRAFLPDALPRSLIEQILEVAQRTASWCNAQPWQVLIASGAAIEAFRTALMEHVLEHDPEPDIPFPQQYIGRYLDRRRDCGFALYRAVGIERGDRVRSAEQALENFRLFGAPHVAIVTTDASLGPYGAVDCGGYIASFLLAAQSLGIATIAQAAIASRSSFVRRHFGLAADRQVVAAISFGREDEAHPANRFRTGRAPLHEAVEWRD